MIKELKYVFYLIVVFLFIFFTAKYYFSDENKKNYYRSLKILGDKIESYTSSLPLLKSDTENIIEYVENSENQNKETYHFWILLDNNEK
jgi:cell shape-determining protein MreC